MGLLSLGIPLLPSLRPFRVPEWEFTGLKLRVNVHSYEGDTLVKECPALGLMHPSRLCAVERGYFHCEPPLPREDSSASLESSADRQYTHARADIMPVEMLTG